MQPTNLLPYDGNVQYYPGLLTVAEAGEYFHALQEQINWKADEVMMFGKRIITKRKMAWYATAHLPYQYSGITRIPLPFNEVLYALLQKAEQASGETFNACLLNLYHNGQEAMGWHSDDEKTIVPNSAIASISLGAERRFLFRHKQTKEQVETLLHNGSLLVMKGNTQQCWQHALPAMKKTAESRINLTFRKMIVP